VIYTLRFTKKAQKQFDALDKDVQKRIRDYLDRNVHGNANPRLVGKVFAENMAGYWRYRIGGCRVICEIRDGICEVLAVNAGHRNKYNT
jgi:mRNA interferase RelE/StbE